MHAVQCLRLEGQWCLRAWLTSYNVVIVPHPAGSKAVLSAGFARLGNRVCQVKRQQHLSPPQPCDAEEEAQEAIGMQWQSPGNAKFDTRAKLGTRATPDSRASKTPVSTWVRVQTPCDSM